MDNIHVFLCVEQETEFTVCIWFQQKNKLFNLEFLLYYLTKPEYQLTVREEIYLDSMLDLF